MADVNEPKRALVVGAGSGIGRATALRLAEQGVTTAAADLNSEAAQELAEKHENIVALGDVSWDATDPEACERMLEEAVGVLGRVDHVISTVGWTAITPFLEESPEYWRRIIDVNLMSSIYLSAAAGRVLRDHGGSIVLTSSEAGTVGTSGETVYSAAKAGVIALVKSLAREWARHGIRVNAVAPGITATPLLESQGGDSLLAGIVRHVPLRRAGEPEEIAAALAFMALDDASYITGQTLCVGGGLTMGS
ncbi:SDR family oxidoreductase [Streptomyces sp. NBC_01795]|uniref:SDR family NAD(P)-dependent oxidoreductase n=1 Tax=unclassified Streptomyces TaxID=2593676 RepID=UPI002DD89689|nr:MULTISPECIES: SDR family oxidoreductase [unclassified Streptomyces]WSA90600.1 SDR family oxidoreductase [Streptomyces sp. NBC_01795]WSB74926.1 SDR family oxidoreductase [Streptomyces sp. NBC_01775]WSS16793.1 SDR family oxidoreductase [Streptomyces sp. NBC_01186]